MLPGFDVLYNALTKNKTKQNNPNKQTKTEQKTHNPRTECAELTELASHLENILFRFHLYKMHLQLTEFMNKETAF